MSEYFEKAAIMWDSDPNRLVMTQTIAQAMLNRINPQGTELLLDYGTGTGLIALQLYSSLKKVIGVDSPKNMLVMFREKIDDRKILSIEPLEWSIGQDIQKFPRLSGRPLGCSGAYTTIAGMIEGIFIGRKTVSEKPYFQMFPLKIEWQ
jgi:hypothetical protein